MQRALLAAHLRAAPQEQAEEAGDFERASSQEQAGGKGVGDFERATRLPGGIAWWGFVVLKAELSEDEPPVCHIG